MWTVCICGRVTKGGKYAKAKDWYFPKKKVTKRIIKRAIDKGKADFYHCPKCARASQS